MLAKPFGEGDAGLSEQKHAFLSEARVVRCAFGCRCGEGVGMDAEIDLGLQAVQRALPSHGFPGALECGGAETLQPAVLDIVA
jgi:hypothetical protein